MLRFAIDRGVLLSVTITILCLFGLVAMVRVPVQMTPSIERPIISVRTYWPGATPQDVEAEILIEQEQHLRRLQGVLKMTSEARTGSAIINLEFNIGTPIQDALVRVNNALSQVANYPENVDPPKLVTSSSDQDAFIFYNLLANHPEKKQFSRVEMSQILDKHILTQLERVPGVAEVLLYGAVDQQVQLIIDPAKLAARGITIAKLRDAIKRRNRDISGGDIDAGKRRYMIRTIGRYQSLEQIADTIISEKDGHVVRVRDVGEVVLGTEELRSRSYNNGQPSFLFGIVRTVGANVIDVLDTTTVEVAELNSGVLKQLGVRIDHYADDVGYVKDAIRVVQKNLILGGLLACIILYLFLRSLAPTLLGAIGIPICTIGAFLGILITGRTLNVISLAGVAFAIGMTLDNSIVVLENIFRHRALGKTSYKAALDGVNEVWSAVLASTLTTIFVFIPILLIEDEVGQLYSDIAIAISAAILMSMFVAITAVPSIAARFSGVPPASHQHHNVLKPFTRIAEKFQNAVMDMTVFLLASRQRRLFTVLGTFVLCAIIFVFLTPRAEYLPTGEENKIFIIMLPPPGYNLDETDRASRSLETLLLPQLNADGSAFKRGETKVPPIKYLLRAPSTGMIFGIAATLSDKPEHADALRDVISDHLKNKAGIIGFANRGSIFSDNSGGSRSIQLDIIGPNLNDVYDTALQTYIKSQEVFKTAQIRPLPGLTISQPTVEIHPNWQRAAELGFDTKELGYLIWALSDGAYLDDYFLDDEKIDIYLHSTKAQVGSPDDIGQLPIYSPSGTVVPLSALAEIRQTVNADKVRRVDGRRAVTLNLIPPPDIPLETAIEMVQNQVIQSLEDDGKIASNVQVQLGGASDKLSNARQALSGNFIIGVILSYLVMVAIFSHWGYPLIILLTIPLGISGGILGLWLMNHVFGFNMALDMITMLGMVVLIGTVVNNPILLVEQTRRLLANGVAIKDAVQESVRIRLRPIMMSMLTTIFGLSPVVFLSGAGTELYRGLGALVLFGLLFSTVLTLTFLPALLSLLLEFFSARSIKRNPITGD